MFTFKHFYLINEGGAGGHMSHPFDLPEVQKGSDLVNVFRKTVNYLKKNVVPLKIDGTNASVRLVTDATGKKQFAFFRGTKEDVLTPVTIDKVDLRFPSGHGLIQIAKEVLTIFNESLEGTADELEELGIYNDPMAYLNIEYVKGSTNVIGYTGNYFVIHYPGRIVEKVSKIRKTAGFATESVPYNSKAINAYASKVNEYAQGHGFTVVHQFAAKLTEQPDLDSVLGTTLTIENNSQPLNNWLQSAPNPSSKTIYTVEGKPIAAINQGLYLKVVEQNIPLSSLIKPEGIEYATYGIVFWHATRFLGKAILENMTSELGPVSQQEGIVINNKAVGSSQFKITGDFFVRNAIQSPFRKEAKAAKKIIVIYPGRFQPFHKGHASVYNALKLQFPQADVLIATSDKVSPPDSPFTFDERIRMIVAAGVPGDAVVKTANPYLAKEILSNYDPASTIAVFAVGAKDMEGPAPRFAFGLTKKGTPTYYQPFTDIKNAQGIDKHGYIITAPTTTFKVLNSTATGATAIRELWKRSNEQKRKQIIVDLYGKFLPDIYNLFTAKIV